MPTDGALTYSIINHNHPFILFYVFSIKYPIWPDFICYTGLNKYMKEANKKRVKSIYSFSSHTQKKDSEVSTVKKPIILTLILTLPVIVFFIGCRKLNNYSLIGRLKEDPNLDFYDISDTITYDKESETIPEKITEQNFIAYYSHSGSSSAEQIYIIRNEGGILNAYARSFNNGKAKTYITDNLPKEKIFTAMSKLNVISDNLDNTDGGKNSYAYLYYYENGKTCRCMTNNVLTEN